MFVKFALSEDGFKPWSKIGTYAPVVGIEIPEGMPPLEDVALWPSDDVLAYKNLSKVRDFGAINHLSE